MNHKIMWNSVGDEEDAVLHEKVAKRVAKEVHVQEK
jgi:hypothetical protein